MESSKKWEDLDLSGDEVKRLTEALKNEEFRKLLAEYAEEISDPENRKRYEDEIAQLENERGMDVKFVNPDPGYVIKTSTNGKVKTFVNVCKNEHIEKPKCSKKISPDGKSGHSWAIPHSFAPVREDADKQGDKCKVIDFVVHPETYRMAESNSQFKNMLHDTAFEGIEKMFDLKVDKKNVKFPKMKFKGTPTATVIRSKKDGSQKASPDTKDPLTKVPYPYGEKTSQELAEERQAKVAARQDVRKSDATKSSKTPPKDSDYETPQYNIIHRGYFDLQDFRAAPDAKASTRPKELVVEIQLPLLKSAASVDLDVMEKKLVLESDKPAKYKLELDLPYPVDEEKGGAKFDKGKHKLIVTIPVLAAKMPPLPFRGDGVDAHPVAGSAEQGAEPEMDLKLPCTADLDRPLIQVLSSEESMNRDGGDTGGDSSDVSNSEEVAGVKDAAGGDGPLNSADMQCPKEPSPFYAFPAFDYLQDDETVTVILDVKNAVRESVDKRFVHVEGKCRGLDMKLTSLGPGGFPMHYGCVVKFAEGCVIEESNSYVDVGVHNVVVTFVKTDECLGAWETLQIGQNEETLEEKVFLSEKTLKAELDQLDLELSSQQPVVADEMPDLEVKDMNSAQLTIEIQEKRGTRRSVSESGEDIEVVHEKQLPKLHGILKQRTVSESSDDLACSYSRQMSAGAESLISESDENGEWTSGEEAALERKKSVSFSDHVDSAMFKQNQSVSSMRQTLKNKRKKQRRNEKRQHGRRRRSSNSVSEPSSDELTAGEGNKRHSAGVTSQEECSAMAPADIAKDSNQLAPNEKPSPHSATETSSQGPILKAHEHSEASAPNPSSISNDVTGHKSTTLNSVPKSEQLNGGLVNGIDSEGERKVDPVDTNSVTTKGSIKSDDVTNADERTTNGYDSDDYEEAGEEATASGAAGASGTADGARPAKDPDAPETLLNWSEGPMDEALRPKCAVALSNSAMFDLDVD